MPYIIAAGLPQRYLPYIFLLRSPFVRWAIKHMASLAGETTTLRKRIAVGAARSSFSDNDTAELERDQSGY